ncbi:HAD family hydrolase [Rhizobium rhizogenes]|uniref:HAD family hydrolase n=1 Tax=Rhizobium rhizogenes TaxID=359 RepID=UPI0015729E14|nr:HAD hydrolase-like protein [Rhizobium rhizogenes]NTI31335.1 HAD family hydrolase [Rhizobium rhizogenes]
MMAHIDFQQYGHIVFDWNGTIVDDVDLALDCVNRLRIDLGLVAIDLPTYRELFQFPISTFYRELGFDFNKTPFEELVLRYLRHFDLGVADCRICHGFYDLALYLKSRRIPISILSATQQATLERAVHCKEVAPLVENLFGLADHIAANKMERASELDRLIAASSSATILMIGDTDHDHEVASRHGWDFVAIASGHQARSRLEKLNAPVFDDLAMLLPPTHSTSRIPRHDT